MKAPSTRLNNDTNSSNNSAGVALTYPTFRNSLHLSALSEFFVATKRSDAKQLLITFVLALLLMLPACTLILAQGFNNASENLKQARRITVFMSADTSHNTATELAATLTLNYRIQSAIVVNTNADLADRLTTDVQTPFSETPIIVELVPTSTLDKAAVIELADQLGALAGIEFVELNKERLDKNASALKIATLLTKMSNVAALIIAAMFTLLISRRDIHNNKSTISLMQQVGATSTVIRRPFLYRSIALSIVGGILSLVWVFFGLGALLQNVDLSTYNVLIPTKPSVLQLLMFFAMVVIAGLLATKRTFTKILHQ